jgi:hypothetical protein
MRARVSINSAVEIDAGRANWQIGIGQTIDVQLIFFLDTLIFSSVQKGWGFFN